MLWPLLTCPRDALLEVMAHNLLNLKVGDLSSTPKLRSHSIAYIKMVAQKYEAYLLLFFPIHMHVKIMKMDVFPAIHVDVCINSSHNHHQIIIVMARSLSITS